MYKVILFICALSYGLVATAQKHVYEDLLVLLIDEKYKQCLSKSLNYSEKEDCRKDPLPYLYISMCYYEMSKLEEYDEDYPKAFRDALKYAKKFRKKDKNVEFFHNYEDYWSELNTDCAGVAEIYMDEMAWSKAKRYYDYMVNYHPENPGAWLHYSLAQKKYGQVREADESLMKFDETLAAIPDLGNLSEDQKKLLKSALIKYAEELESEGSKTTALEYLEKGRELYRGDKEFEGYYQSLK